MSSMTLGLAIKSGQEAYERSWSDRQEIVESSTSKTGRHSATTPVAAIESANRASEGSLQRRVLRKVQQCCYHYLGLGAQSEAGDIPDVQIPDEYDDSLAWEALCLTKLSQKLPKQLHQHLAKHPKKTGKNTAKAISKIYGVPYWKELGYQNPPSRLKRFDVAIQGGYEIGLKFLIKEELRAISREEFKETASRIIKAFPEEDEIIASVLAYPHLPVNEKALIFHERSPVGEFLVESIAKNDLLHSAGEYLKIRPSIKKHLTGLSIAHQSKRVLGQLLIWELGKNNPSMDDIRHLLANGADVNVQDQKGATPLHVAAAKGQKEFAEFLLANGVDVNVKDQKGGTPLHWAAPKGQIEVAELLLANGADVHVQAENGLTPLHVATAKGQKEFVELLLANGADVHVQNENGLTPLHWAAMNGKKEVVELLLANGVGVNVQDENGSTPLHWAAMYGKKEVVELLLANGVDVNVQDENGSTPLHVAASKGQIEVASLLVYNEVENEAEPSIQDQNGLTPLHLAIEHGHRQIAYFLVPMEGVELDIQDENGSTPLHVAISKGQESIAHCIIEWDANVDIQDQKGLTPLHLAAMNGLERIVDFLKLFGASQDICNHENKTACDLAKEKGHTKIVQLLSNKGKKRKRQSTQTTGVKKPRMSPRSL